MGIHRDIASWRSIAVAMMASAMLTGVSGAAPQATEEPPHLERPDNAPGRPAMVTPDARRAQLILPTDLVSIFTQVNVSQLGEDILGDAANEPSIAIDPTSPNRMAIGWRQFDTIASNFRQAGVAWTNDGGRTWNPSGPLTPGLFRSDPVLGADSQGNFYYYSLRPAFGTLVCDMFTSSDGGQTWSEPVFAFGGDKAWMGIDRTGFSSDGNIYLAWSLAGACCGPDIFTRSLDGGFSFMTPIPEPSPAVWGTIAVGSAGELYVAGVSGPFNNNSNFVVLKSTTFGDPSGPAFDFASAVDMNGVLAASRGPNPGGLLGQVWIETDRSGGPNDGNVYMVCSVDPPGADPLDVHFVRSVDGGLTWSDPVRLNDDDANSGAWQWHGTMSVAPNGRIDVVWNDTRHDDNVVGPNLSELHYTSSHDGGRTWAANVALSAPFNPFLGYPNPSKLGAYYHMVSANSGANLAWAATFNGGQDVYYMRIGANDCNGNGVPDDEEIARQPRRDCNANGIPDTCDVAAGLLNDRDGDGVFDECADCNKNRRVDALDIFEGSSPDCDRNGIPDESDPDCDGNGVPDACDLAVFQAQSPRMSPLSPDSILEFVISDPPPPLSDVRFTVEALGDLGAPEQQIQLRLNGFRITELFDTGGDSCPDTPNVDEFSFSAASLVTLLQFDPEGDVNLRLVPMGPIDGSRCDESHYTITVSYETDTGLDDNGNGVPDACEPPNCQERAATIWVGPNGIINGGGLDGMAYFGYLLGTDGDDVIVGTDGRDVIFGLGGSDVICAGDGDDLIRTQDGDDSIDGGDGFDKIRAGEGTDTCVNGERNEGCDQ
jgi:hypothetical protein